MGSLHKTTGAQLEGWNLIGNPFGTSATINMGIVNWSVIGALLLVVLFQGSSSLAEEISGGKYPEYEKYCQSVPRFFPGRKKEFT